MGLIQDIGIDKETFLSYWENKLGVILLFGVGTQPNLQDQEIAHSSTFIHERSLF